MDDEHTNTSTNTPTKRRSCCQCPRWIPEGTTFTDLLLCRAGPRSNDGLGFALHGFARGSLAFALAAFFNPYMTSLATLVSADSSPVGYVNWLGIVILPTSYVSTASTVFLVFSAILVPYIGALADSTPYRRTYLVWFTNISAMFAILCGIVDLNTWYMAGVLQILSLSFYDWSLAFVYAYLPEAAKTETERTRISAHGVLGTNGSQMLLMPFLALLLVFIEPNSLKLTNGSFESGFASWNIDNTTSNFPLLNLNSIQTCSSTEHNLCTSTGQKVFDGYLSLMVNTTGLDSSVAIYQAASNKASDLAYRSGLLEAYITSTNISACEVRVYLDSEGTSSTKRGTANGFSVFVLPFSTSSNTQSLSYEIVVPANAVTYIDNVSVTTTPTKNAAYFAMATGVWFLIFGLICYTNFGERPLPEDQKPKSAWHLFKQVNSNLYDTIKLILTSSRMSLWFLAFGFSNAGGNVIVSLAGTYITNVLGVPSLITSVALLVSQIFGIPGAYLSVVVGRRIGLQHSLAVAYAMFTLGIIVVYYSWVDSSTPQANIWLMLMYFGVAGGAGLALARSAFSAMIPEGREAEFMGIYSLGSKYLSWIGPLLFTAVNEATKSFRTAYLAASMLYILATLFQFMVLFTKDPVEVERREKRIREEAKNMLISEVNLTKQNALETPLKESAPLELVQITKDSVAGLDLDQTSKFLAEEKPLLLPPEIEPNTQKAESETTTKNSQAECI